MGTKRQGRTGLFSGASRTPRKPSAGSHQSPSSLAGVSYSWDLASDLLTWGPNASKVLGLSARDLPKTGRGFAQLIEPDSGLGRHEAVSADSSPSGAYDTRYALRFAPDRVVMMLDAGRWQPGMDARPAFVRGLLRPDPQASTPDLLPAAVKARSNLLLTIQNDINEALRFSHTCTLIIGSFEDDSQTIPLETVGRLLRPMMRHHDHFMLVGPNRFALTLTCCPASEAVSAMKRLAALLEPYAVARPLHLGAACAPDHTFKAPKLLRFAEAALERAIGSSERAILHKTRFPAPSSGSDQASLDLIAALNDRRLILARQPVVDALTRAPVLMQACAAIQSALGHLVPIGSIPASEEVNLGLLVDGRMLELAADYLARHPGERMALPIQPQTLQDPEWLPMLAAHLGARPRIESRLVIEIPEAALAGGPSMLGRLHAMKALGIGLALTGFGAGHILPGQLPSLPIDILKVDGVFIQPLRRSTDDRLYVRTLIDRAQHLGIATAAEWVADEATARLLASWGVDYLQGPLFGEPEVAPHASSLLQASRQARA